MSRSVNIATRLHDSARRDPDQPAVVQPRRRNRDGSYQYDVWTFGEFEAVVDRLTAGLAEMGVPPGARMVLFVPFSREFLALTFALFRIGAVVVLIDPGMGKANIFRCLEEVRPDGFVAVPLVHAVRTFKRRLFPNARWHVTVGRRWFWGGRTYRQLLQTPASHETTATQATDPAAIIYTSGSTGPPKGVVYEHGMFDAQVEMIRDFYGIEPGEIDLAGFPLFGLFNAAMGVTTVIPDMDPTRPAAVDPANIVQHIRDWDVTQAFGSPAFWNRVGRNCEARNIVFPSLKRGLSAGGPVPNHVLQRVSRTLSRDFAELHTPYGATECLPVASIGSTEVLSETAEATRRGAGTCVGRPFPGVDVRIIDIVHRPIDFLCDAVELAAGEIGEIIVRSPSVTREYISASEATRHAKIRDDAYGIAHAETPEERRAPVASTDQPARVWHRMGDVGYRDEQGRLWFCGRKAHIVDTENGRHFSVCCEAIFNEHPRVYRTALVGTGHKPRERPVMVVEAEEGAMPQSASDETRFRNELLELGAASELTRHIQDILFHPSLPVDTRHNVKINREALAEWAASRLMC